MLRLSWFALVAAAASISVSVGAAAPGNARLAFDVREGLNLNSFLRVGDVASHVVLRSGTEPRILVTFPAGNSSVGVWFEHVDRAVEWTERSVPQPVREPDEKNRPLRGVVTDLSVVTPELRVRATVLSSTRVLRDFQVLNEVPSEVA